MAIISRGGRVIDPYGGQADGMGAAMQGLAQAANIRQMQQQRTLEQIAPIAQDLIQRFGIEQARTMNPGLIDAYEGIVGNLGDAQATAQQMANIQMERLAQGALSGGVPTSTPINIQEQAQGQQQPGTVVSDVTTTPMQEGALAPQMPTGGFGTGGSVPPAVPPPTSPAPPSAPATRQLTPEEEALLQQQATDVGLGGGDAAARPPAPTQEQINAQRAIELRETLNAIDRQISINRAGSTEAPQGSAAHRQLMNELNARRSELEEELLAVDPTYGLPSNLMDSPETTGTFQQSPEARRQDTRGEPGESTEFTDAVRSGVQRSIERGQQRSQELRTQGQVVSAQRPPVADAPPAPATAAPQQQEESYYDFTNRVITNASLREGMDSVQSANAVTLESFGLPSNAIGTILSSRGTDAYTQPSEALGGRTPYEVDWMRQGVIAQLQGTTVLQPNADGSLPPYQAQMNFMRSSTPQDARAIAAVATTGDAEVQLEPTEEAPSPSNLITSLSEETREDINDTLSNLDASYDGSPEDLARAINFDFENPLEERFSRMPAPAAQAIRTQISSGIENRVENFRENIRTVLRRSSENNQPGALAVSGQMAEENTSFLGRSYQTAGGPLLGNIDNARQHMDQIVNFMNEYPEVFRDNLAVRQAVANIEQVEAQTRTMEANLVPHLVFYYGQDAVPGIREEAVRHMEGMRNLEFGITEVQFLQLYDQWQFNRYMMNNPQAGGDPKIQLEVLQAITRILESESNTDRQQELIAPFVMLLNNLGTNMFFETQRNEAFLPKNRRTFLEGIDMAQMQQMQQQMQQETDAARMGIASQVLGLGQLPIIGAPQQ